MIFWIALAGKENEWNDADFWVVLTDEEMQTNRRLADEAEALRRQHPAGARVELFASGCIIADDKVRDGLWIDFGGVNEWYKIDIGDKPFEDFFGVSEYGSHVDSLTISDGGVIAWFQRHSDDRYFVDVDSGRTGGLDEAPPVEYDIE